MSASLAVRAAVACCTGRRWGLVMYVPLFQACLKSECVWEKYPACRECLFVRSTAFGHRHKPGKERSKELRKQGRGQEGEEKEREGGTTAHGRAEVDLQSHTGTRKGARFNVGPVNIKGGALCLWFLWSVLLISLCLLSGSICWFWACSALPTFVICSIWQNRFGQRATLALSIHTNRHREKEKEKERKRERERKKETSVWWSL